MSSTVWSKPQRQAPAGLILFFGDNFRKIIRLFFPVIIGVVLHKSESDKTMLYLWSVIALLILVSVSAVLSYLYFKFSIEDDEFVLQKGFLKKVRLTVPLERIQTINIKQNILQKLLGVVSLEVDTAGTANVEVKLKAIKYDLAKDLEEALKKSSGINRATINNDIEQLSCNDREEVILRLDGSDLFKVSITENHFKSFLLILVFVNWIYNQVKNFYNDEVKRLAREGINTVEELDVSLWVEMLVFMVIVSIAISFIRVFLRFYDFRLARVGRTFLVRFGLLNKREVNVPLSKIQLLEAHTNPLRKLLGFQTLVLKQASSDDIKKKQTIAVPACRSLHLKKIEDYVFGNEESEFTPPLRSHAIFFVRGFLFFSLPVLGLAIFASYMIPVFSWWMFIVYELVIAVLFFMAMRKRQFRINDTLIEITKGMVGTAMYRMPIYKIQGVKFRQTIFQKLKKRAGLTVYTASGDELTVPYIEEQEARRIFNYLLYKIESTGKPWM